MDIEPFVCHLESVSCGARRCKGFLTVCKSFLSYREGGHWRRSLEPVLHMSKAEEGSRP